MFLEDAIRERLLSLSPLASLVGTRIYPGILPQGEVRASVTLQNVDKVIGQHLRGPVYPGESRLQTVAYVTASQSTDEWNEVQRIGAAIFGDGLGEDATGLFGFIGSIGGSPAAFRIANVSCPYSRGPYYEFDNEVRRCCFHQDFYVKWSPLT